jgi:hypothetical protein
MRPWGVPVLAVAGALALPAPASAVDHVSLFVSPSALAAGPGWRLSASVPANEFVGRNALAITLLRSPPSGVLERHQLIARLPTATVSFNGRRGRWNVRNQLGPVLSANMAIVAMGAASPLERYLECSGAFAQVPVALRGTLVLRTQTTFFGTIRRVRLRGTVVFNRGGPVACERTTSVCMPTTWFDAWTADGLAALYATPAAGGTLSLRFREQLRLATGVTADWYHVLSLTRFSPLSGTLPRLDVRAPAALPLTGAGSFTAGEATETTLGPCRVTRVQGTFTGSFRARFAGWGVRTLDLTDGGASYTEAR